MSLLEAYIRGSPRLQEYDCPIFDHVASIERAMAVLFQEFMRGDVLSSGLTPCHEPEMISPKTSGIGHRKYTVNNHCEGHVVMLDGAPEREVVIGGIFQAVTEATEYKVKPQQRACAYKAEEIAIVSSPDTIIDPHTVMIQALNAIVADPAMMASWRPPNVAGLTIFSRHVHSGVRRAF